jgi:hypothetical protein
MDDDDDDEVDDDGDDTNREGEQIFMAIFSPTLNIN